MARYIDADKLKKRAYPFPCAIGVEYAVSVRQIDEAPTADVVPHSEIEKIFAEIEDLLRGWFDHFRQGDDIRESCAIMAALSQVTEFKKKYTEEET